MAEETRTLGIRLEDETSGPADSAAASLERMAEALDRASSSAEKGVRPPAMVAESFRQLAVQAEKLSGIRPPAIVSADFSRAITGAAKLSSALELAAKRADSLRKAESALEKESFTRANRLPTALQSSGGGTSLFQGLIQSIGKILGPRAGGQAVEGARLLGEAADRMGPLMPLLKAGAGLLKSGAVAIGVAAAALVAAAAYIGIKALAFVARSGIEASDAKARALAGLGAGGEKTRGDVLKVAVDLGLDPERTEEFMTRAKQLLSVGFARNQVPVVLKTVADFEITNGQEKANALATQLEKIQSKGKFNEESVSGLAEAGVRAEYVYKALADKTGLAMDVVKAKVKAGQIEVEKGVEAILAAAERQAGGSAALASNTVGAKFNGLKTLASTLFEDIDTGPLKGALDTLKEILGGPGGAELKTSLTKLGSQLFKTLLGPFEGPDGKRRLESFLQTIIKLADTTTRVLEEAAPYVESFVDLLDTLFGKGDLGSSPRFEQLNAFLESIRSLLSGDLVGFRDNLLKAFGFEGLGDTIRSEASALGDSFVSGFVGAIRGGAASAINAAIDLVRGAIGGAQGAQDSHSPSRVTGLLGRDFTAGYLGQIRASNDNAYDVGARFVAAATGGAGDAQSSEVPSADGGGGGGVTIVVQVTAAPGVTPDQARAQGQAVGDGAYEAWEKHWNRKVRNLGRAA